MANLEAYIPIVGENVIADIKLLSRRLQNKVIQNINSTAVGGGVAEILIRMVPILRELGIDARWDFITGEENFFQVTKKFHNALHGRQEEITPQMFDIFWETSQRNIKEVNITGDIVYVHDPQPIALVTKRKGMSNKWIWRCHIDVSNPDLKVWDYLQKFIFSYDACVFSAPSFSRKLPIRQFLISPSIDPLSDKNRELSPELIKSVLVKYGITSDKPIITQVSRFDRLKDPVGVIEAFLHVRKYNDCQLVLAGGTADDDPEGFEVLAEVKEKANGHPDIHILLVPSGMNLEINALQSASAIIIQKSLKEGFGLTVSEALWKAKPVVASGVGGIPLQITHKYSGLLCHSVEGAAFAVKQLLNNPEYAKRLGENGREHVRQNFLITRHLREYLLLFLVLYHSNDLVYL